MALANPKAPNRAAPVSGVALTGRRSTSFVPRGRPETAADMKTNERSSDRSANYGRQNQSRPTNDGQ